MRLCMAALVLIVASPCWAAEATVTSADTLILNGTPYRLDGVDAPTTDQVCLDGKGSVWACGIEARNQLKTFIGKRDVQCESKRFDLAYRNRRMGNCKVDGETLSLNQWLVRQGWAISFEPYARSRFKSEQEEARTQHKGLWQGCFIAPHVLRDADTSSAMLLGSACPKDKHERSQDVLLPAHPAMPQGCSIKGNFAMRAHITGHRGIYHLEGCKSYERLKTPDRWFCSEKEAEADGFRLAFTCKPNAGRR